MRKVSIRLPDDILTAYDRAEGNRSQLMRRQLTDAVANGELDVHDDLVQLAEREGIVDRAKLARKRGTFRERMTNYFGDRWEDGATPPDDARDLAQSWFAEAALYGEEHLAYAEAMIEWYEEHWQVHDRPDWPGAGRFLQLSGDVAVSIPNQLEKTMQNAKEHGLEAEKARRHAEKFHPPDLVDQAIAGVYDE